MPGPIEVVSKLPRFTHLTDEIKDITSKLLLLLDRPEASLNIFLITDPAMAELNQVARHKDKATNILSFPAPDNFPHPGHSDFLGDLYLAPDFYTRAGDDLKFLLIHGLLHLLGHTHDSTTDTALMEATEHRLLQAFK